MGDSKISHRDKKLLYHLTEIHNLESLLEHGLLSRAALEQHGMLFRDVADHQILGKRGLHGLEQLVPFHFICKSPFDYAVVKRHPTCRFMLITVLRDRAKQQGWKVIPKHPLADNSEPEVLEWDAGIEAIDWLQMDKEGRAYGDDAHCRLTCMAEALSPHPVKRAEWSAIYVATEETQSMIQPRVGSSITVNVNKHMFPKDCL